MSTWDAEPDPDEERPVDPEAEIVLPEQLDPPLEASERDVVEQSIEVPLPEDDGD